MRRPTVHIIGAGLSGLAAAHRLAGAGRFEIVVHERESEPGGRRRAFFDAADGEAVDSFNPVVWPHWRATRALIDAVGAKAQWREGEQAIAFVDLLSNARWTLRPGRWPWAALLPGRRAPGLTAGDYFRLARIATGKRRAPPSGAALEKLWRPLSLAALNIAPEAAAMDLLAAALSEGLAAPPVAPLFPRRDFNHALIFALESHLRREGVTIRCERTLERLRFRGDRVEGLEFDFDRIELGPRDAVVLAVPAWVAARLAPGLLTPDAFTATITAHFAVAPPARTADLAWVLNGPFHALIRREEGLSVTAFDAGSELETPREALAAKYWSIVAAITGLSDDLPAWRLIKQKRAAFAATSEQNALRPEPETPWGNLVLAGAYVRNDCAETMESAARSGERAAEIVAERL
jgi:phytoene dehydrogenase-like protein